MNKVLSESNKSEHIVRQVLHRINNNPVTFKFFHDLPQLKFLRIDQLNTFNRKKPSPILVLYLFQKPLRTVTVDIDLNTPTRLPLGNIHYLVTSGLNFGYLFEFPVYPFIQGENYFGIKKYHKDKYEGVETVLINQNITILGYQDKALLVLGNNGEKWIDRQGYYGKKGPS